MRSGWRRAVRQLFRCRQNDALGCHRYRSSGSASASQVTLQRGSAPDNDGQPVGWSPSARPLELIAVNGVTRKSLQATNRALHQRQTQTLKRADSHSTRQTIVFNVTNKVAIQSDHCTGRLCKCSCNMAAVIAVTTQCCSGWRKKSCKL